MAALRFILALVAILASAALIATVWEYTEGHEAHEKQEAKDKDKEKDEHHESRVSRTEDGATLIKLTDEERKLSGIQSQPVAAATLSPQLTAYGVLEIDPEAIFDLRAGAAGLIRTDAQHAWPKIGDTLAANSVVGSLEPRWAPTVTELTDLATKLAEARAAVTANEAAAQASKLELDRLTQLNQRDKNVSDRVVQEASARAIADAAKLTAARQSLATLESAAKAQPGKMPATPLLIPRAGSVLEVNAFPNTIVEAGALIMRVGRLDTLWARVSVPPGQAFDPTAHTATVHIGDAHLEAKVIGVGTTASESTLQPTLLLRVTVGNHLARPGQPITASLNGLGEPATGVAVPRAAIVRLMGKSWVFIETEPNHFVRREITASATNADAWITATLKPGDRVVTVGPQLLLSEELKSLYSEGGD